MIKSGVILILFLSFAFQMGRAQDYYANFNQYRIEGLIINPAFAGSREVLSASFFYRQNWLGFKGAPSYQTICAHTPLKNYKLGAGVHFLHEQKDITNGYDLFFNYAYRINLPIGKISLGLKAGLRYTVKDMSSIQLSPRDPIDPVFTDAENYLFPNFGFGFFYYTKKFFLGGSVPYVFAEQSSNDEKGVKLTHNFDSYNYFFNTGFKFGRAEGVKITPSLMFLYKQNSPLQYEGNVSVEFLEERFAVGAGYRAKNAILGHIQVKVNEQLRIGYTYDSFFGRAVGFGPTQEIMLRYEFKYVIKATNPFDF